MKEITVPAFIENKNTSENRIAVLIDAENVPSAYVKVMLEEIARYGTPTIKRIYADWTSPCVSAWKSTLLENAINPIQQYSYTHGKNSTDSAMIIDAMDILYGGSVDTFCIVSSDSDFTKLATRIRESGKFVLGIGEKKTPQAFITACNKFIFLEILAPEKKLAAADKKPLKKNSKVQTKKAEPPHDAENDSQKNRVHDDRIIPEEVEQLIINSVLDLADDDGWAFLGDIGNLILKKQPSFDSRNFGFEKLTPMLAATGIFEIDKRQTANPGIKHIFIRLQK